MSQDLIELLGQRTRAVRDARSMSQTTLGVSVGLTQPAILKIEKGKYTGLRLDTFLALASALNVRPVDLLVPHAASSQVRIGGKPVHAQAVRGWFAGDEASPATDGSRAAYLELLEEMPPAERRQRQVWNAHEVKTLKGLQHWVTEAIHARQIEPGKRLRGLIGTPKESRAMLAQALEESLTKVTHDVHSMINELRGVRA